MRQYITHKIEANLKALKDDGFHISEVASPQIVDYVEKALCRNTRLSFEFVILHDGQGMGMTSEEIKMGQHDKYINVKGTKAYAEVILLEAEDPIVDASDIRYNHYITFDVCEYRELKLNQITNENSI